MNPFYTTYKYIPFDKIAETDFEPAMLKGIEEEDKEIAKGFMNILLDVRNKRNGEEDDEE